MVAELSTQNAEETENLGRRLAGRVKPGTVIVLEGPLGSGKTTLVKGLAKGLGIADTVTSPSFTIMAEYEGPVRLVHVDLYRTDSDAELDLLGMREKLTDHAVIVIEWGEKATDFLPQDYVHVSFDIGNLETRNIRITGAEL